MIDEEKTPNETPDESALNKQMSPFASGAFLGIIAAAFTLYRSHDTLRALLAGAIAFAAAFWVVLAGQYLERRNKKKSDNELDS